LAVSSKLGRFQGLGVFSLFIEPDPLLELPHGGWPPKSGPEKEERSEAQRKGSSKRKWFQDSQRHRRRIGSPVSAQGIEAFPRLRKFPKIPRSRIGRWDLRGAPRRRSDGPVDLPALSLDSKGRVSNSRRIPAGQIGNQVSKESARGCGPPILL